MAQRDLFSFAGFKRKTSDTSGAELEAAAATRVAQEEKQMKQT